MKRRKFLEYDDGYGADVHDAVHDAVHAEDPIEEAEEEWPEWEQEQEQRGQQMMSQQVDKPWSSSAFKPQAGQGAAATGTSIAKSNRPQRSVSEIPERWRRLFPFGLFNAMQSACLDYVLHGTDHIVVTAPTGAGKTVVLELAILQEAMHRQGFKAVYMAPSKSLCSERYEDWKRKLAPLGLHCLLLTSDSDNDLSSASAATVLVSTPEKWDSLTRRWKESRSVMEHIKLFVIDEVHMLSESRGPTLEAVVSRMKTVHQKSGDKIRFVAVSATIPNLQDIATWLGSEGLPAKMLYFDASYRPVPLQRVVVPFPPNKNAFIFDHGLNYKLLRLITQYNDDRPTLVFCNTRKSAQNAAHHLLTEVEKLGPGRNPFVPPPERRRQASSLIQRIKDRTLQDYTSRGVGFHHAGLHFDDRALVEELFTNECIMVICATSTLAVGVNLPAHLVVIKSTQQYVNNAYTEYSELDVLQMIGRAGRPQFDEFGRAVIMTTEDQRDKYENLLAGTQTIESTLHFQLIEYLNAELALGSINDISQAISWLKSSFLYVRMKGNPERYGLAKGSTERDVERKLEELCMDAIKKLSATKLVDLDQEDGFGLKVTEFGRVMARYYVKHKTMETILEMGAPTTLGEVLNVVASAAEFAEHRFQPGNKQILNALNKDKTRPIRFPIKGLVKTIADKISILVQALLGQCKIDSFPLQTEAQQALQIGVRVSRCLMECHKDNFTAQLNAATMCKCFRAKLWENDARVLIQLSKLGVAKVDSLAAANIRSFEQLLRTEPHRIEMLCGRNAPFGHQIKESAAAVPRFALEARELESAPTTILVTVNLTNADDADSDADGGFPHMVLLSVGSEDNRVLYRQQHSVQAIRAGLRVRVNGARPGRTRVELVSMQFVGIDVGASVAIGGSQPKKPSFPQGSIELKVPPANIPQTFDLDSDSGSDSDTLPTPSFLGGTATGKRLSSAIERTRQSSTAQVVPVASAVSKKAKTTADIDKARDRRQHDLSHVNSYQSRLSLSASASSASASAAAQVVPLARIDDSTLDNISRIMRTPTVVRQPVRPVIPSIAPPKPAVRPVTVAVMPKAAVTAPAAPAPAAPALAAPHGMDPPYPPPHWYYPLPPPWASQQMWGPPPPTPHTQMQMQMPPWPPWYYGHPVQPQPSAPPPQQPPAPTYPRSPSPPHVPAPAPEKFNVKTIDPHSIQRAVGTGTVSSMIFGGLFD